MTGLMDGSIPSCTLTEIHSLRAPTRVGITGTPSTIGAFALGRLGARTFCDRQRSKLGPALCSRRTVTAIFHPSAQCNL